MGATLTDQAAVAIAVARSAAKPGDATVAHLLVGLVTEGEGRAGRRLRQRTSAAALLVQRGGRTPAPPLARALSHVGRLVGRRAVTTVDLLDAAIAVGGEDVTDLLDAVGYHRDLDGWLVGDPDADWFEEAETLGWSPGPDETLDPAAARIVAQVRAVSGGALEVLIAAAAAPDAGMDDIDPQALAAAAACWPADTSTFNADIDTVVGAAELVTETAPTTVPDLVRAALIVGGEPTRWVVSRAQDDG